MRRSSPSAEEVQRAWNDLLALGPQPADLVFVIENNIKPFRDQAWELLKGMSDVNAELCELVNASHAGPRSQAEAAAVLLEREPSDEELYEILAASYNFYPGYEQLEDRQRAAWKRIEEGGARNAVLRKVVEGHKVSFDAPAAKMLLKQNPDKDDLMAIVRQFAYAPLAHRAQ